jgi:hypothetical protein
VCRTFRKLLLILLACLVVMGTSAPRAESESRGEAARLDDELRERLIKAAFLFNFARFTKWPAGAFEEPRSPLRFCVLGEDPFGSALDALAGKTVHGRRLAISRLAAVGEAASCHLLFVSASEDRRLVDILATVYGSPTLTVADITDFARFGGVITLTTVANRIRFDVNLVAAHRVGLRFSSRFLSLARIVKVNQE